VGVLRLSPPRREIAPRLQRRPTRAAPLRGAASRRHRGGRGEGRHLRRPALIAAAQKVEHYDISGYGTARTLAGQAGLPAVAALLSQPLANRRDDQQRRDHDDEQERATAEALNRVNGLKDVKAVTAADRSHDTRGSRRYREARDARVIPPGVVRWLKT
jgi:hypothetical protein